MSTPSTTFSAEVRAQLARARKSPAEFADAISVDESTIYRRLNDQSKWPLDDAIATAKWLGVPLRQLLQPAIIGQVGA